jgi:hypothetical protein
MAKNEIQKAVDRLVGEQGPPEGGGSQPYDEVVAKVGEIKHALDHLVSLIDRDINLGSGQALLNDLDRILQDVQSVAGMGGD